LGSFCLLKKPSFLRDDLLFPLIRTDLGGRANETFDLNGSLCKVVRLPGKGLPGKEANKTTTCLILLSIVRLWRKDDTARCRLSASNGGYFPRNKLDERQCMADTLPEGKEGGLRS